jgi:hypothetical protein
MEDNRQATVHGQKQPSPVDSEEGSPDDNVT